MAHIQEGLCLLDPWDFKGLILGNDPRRGNGLLEGSRTGPCFQPRLPPPPVFTTRQERRQTERERKTHRIKGVRP